MNAVVIATTPGREELLANCLKSLTNYRSLPVIVVSDMVNYSYELGKIRFIYQHTDIENFLLLHDTCEIKDPSFIDQVFAYPDSVYLSNSPCPFGMYLGKYKRKVLKQLNIPIVSSLEGAIDQEIKFNCAYMGHDLKSKLLFTDFEDCSRFEMKWGMKRMRLENNYLIKWKSHWNTNKFKGD